MGELEKLGSPCTHSTYLRISITRPVSDRSLSTWVLALRNALSGQKICALRKKKKVERVAGIRAVQQDRGGWTGQLQEEGAGGGEGSQTQRPLRSFHQKTDYSSSRPVLNQPSAEGVVLLSVCLPVIAT